MSRRWVVLSLLFVAIVISYVDRGNLSIAAPSLMRDFRITPAVMGVVLSAFFWTYGTFQVPSGMLVDRFGIRGTYAAGFVVWSAASAAIALCRGAGDVVGMRLVLGVAESIGPLASISFIRNNFEGKDQGLPTSIYIAGQNIGPAAGALVGAMLLDRFGWRTMFAVTGLVSLIWVPFWLLAAKPGSVPPQAPQAVDPAPEPRHWTFSMVLARGTFWGMSAAILLSSYYWYFVLTWVPSYLILARGFSTLEMGKIMSGALFTMAAVNVLAGAVADRLAARFGVFRIRIWFGAAGYLGTAAVLLLLVIPDRSWVLAILTLSMCATGIGNTSFWALSQHVPPANMVGRTIGYLNTLSQIAGAAAPIVTGWILGPQKQFGPAIFIAGVCPVLAAICLFWAGPKGLDRMKALLA